MFKMRKVRFVFYKKHDEALLGQVRQLDPFSTTSDSAAVAGVNVWGQIATNLQNGKYKMNVTARTCKLRARLLLNKLEPSSGPGAGAEEEEESNKSTRAQSQPDDVDSSTQQSTTKNPSPCSKDKFRHVVTIRKPRFCFNKKHDLALLAQVKKYQPFSDETAAEPCLIWKQIATNLQNSHLGMNVTARTCKLRARLLLNKLESNPCLVDDESVQQQLSNLDEEDPLQLPSAEDSNSWWSFNSHSQRQEEDEDEDEDSKLFLDLTPAGINPEPDRDQVQYDELKSLSNQLAQIDQKLALLAKWTSKQNSINNQILSKINSMSCRKQNNHDKQNDQVQQYDKLKSLSNQLAQMEDKLALLVKWTRKQDGINNQILSKINSMSCDKNTTRDLGFHNNKNGLINLNPQVRIKKLLFVDYMDSTNRSTKRNLTASKPASTFNDDDDDNTLSSSIMDHLEDHFDEIKPSSCPNPLPLQQESQKVIKIEQEQDTAPTPSPNADLNKAITTARTKSRASRRNNPTSSNTRTTSDPPHSHICSICSKPYKTSTILKSHIHDVHSQIKPYACTICGRAFARAFFLKEHTLTHSTTRSYSCQYCDATFRQRQGLYSHTNKHLAAKRSSLRCQCWQCGQLFTNKFGLKSHTEHVHEKLRKFACEICGKSFKTSTHLKYHVGTHGKPNGRQRGINRDHMHDEAAGSRIKRVGGVFKVKLVDEINEVVKATTNPEHEHHEQQQTSITE